MNLITNRYTNFYRFDNLSQYNTITNFISTKYKNTNTELNISLENNFPIKETILNRQLLSKAVGIPLNNFVIQNQVHGNNVKVISHKHKGKGIYKHSKAIQNNDAMITNSKNICLFLFAADCVPLLFYDTKKHVIGVAHSGWQGTVKKIAQQTVFKMQEIYNSLVEDIIVGIGPSISVENYEIGENVLKEGKKAFGTINNYFKLNNETNKYHFNLWYANKQQLIDIGIKSTNIEISNLCTYNNSDIFFSARKKDTGRFSAGIMLK